MTPDQMAKVLTMAGQAQVDASSAESAQNLKVDAVWALTFFRGDADAPTSISTHLIAAPLLISMSGEDTAQAVGTVLSGGSAQCFAPHGLVVTTNVGHTAINRSWK